LEQVVDPKRRSAKSVAIRREMDALLQRALERITPNDRQIVDLHYRAGLSRKEIAEKLDMPIEAIPARCDRTRFRHRSAYEILKCEPTADFSKARGEYLAAKDA